MQDYFKYGSGVLNARFPLELPAQVVTPRPLLSVLIQCSITVNFPDIELVSPTYTRLTTKAVAVPPAYSNQPHEPQVTAAVATWGDLLEKLQLPAFRVHRCHHAGVEQAGVGEAFELPTGFPEAVQHVCEIPESVCISTRLRTILTSNLVLLCRLSRWRFFAPL
jgi:hypothetical protein